MRFSYTGKRVPKWYLPVSMYEGWEDALNISTQHERRLYNRPLWLHLLWKIGNLAARVSGKTIK